MHYTLAMVHILWVTWKKLYSKRMLLVIFLEKGIKSIVLNQTCHLINRGSLEITYTISFKYFFEKFFKFTFTSGGYSTSRDILVVYKYSIIFIKYKNTFQQFCLKSEIEILILGFYVIFFKLGYLWICHI